MRLRYESIGEGTRRWNERIAQAYVRRINVLFAIESLDELRTLPQFRFHPLKGDMVGKYAIDLVDRWRLILSLEEQGKRILIEDVSNHYGD